MIRMPATEAIVIVVAEVVIRVPIAEAAQANWNDAKAMTRIPRTETTPREAPKQTVEVAAAVAVEQRSESDDRGRPLDRRAARGCRREHECADDDAVPERASCRFKNGHGSSLG